MYRSMIRTIIRKYTPDLPVPDNRVSLPVGRYVFNLTQIMVSGVSFIL